ncbi:MAG: DMT family transporter [Comamonadaceae bacterium]|nr:MAG: DMT family transporter [Comamonadaceae bacterium]
MPEPHASPSPASQAVSGRGRQGVIASPRPLLGIALLVCAMWVLSGLDATGKFLLSIEVPLIALTWTRYALHMVICLALFLPARGARVLRSRFPRAQIARGCAVACATMLFFSTLRYLPLAEASAINFLAPLLTLTVAPYLLKEKPSAARWAAAGIAFVGVLIIVRPGAGLHPIGTLLGLATACTMCVQHVSTRKIAGDDPFTSLIWTGALGTLLLTPILLWQLDAVGAALSRLSVTQWVLLISTGVTGSIGHLLQIMAYRNAAASTLAPFIYLQILSAAGLGWLIWGHFPDQVTWIGIGVICASGISIAAYEWHNVRRMRRTRSPQPGTT